jgi:intracellular multiplication protein IcmJ
MATTSDSRRDAVLAEAAVRDAGVSWDEATEGMSAPGSKLGANFDARRHKDIVFSVARRVRRQPRQDGELTEPSHADYKDARAAVLARGGGRCVFCGFRSQYTDVHHRNDNHADHREANLEIADPLCHGAQHIGQVGSQRHGVFIHLDGVPQAEVNHLQRTIAVVLEMGSEAEKAEARALLQHLASRAELVATEWGSANPSDFASALHTLHEEDLDKRVSAFTGMVLIYRPVRFAQYVAQWIEESYKSLPIKTWGRIVERTRSAS